MVPVENRQAHQAEDINILVTRNKNKRKNLQAESRRRECQSVYDADKHQQQVEKRLCVITGNEDITCIGKTMETGDMMDEKHTEENERQNRMRIDDNTANDSENIYYVLSEVEDVIIREDNSDTCNSVDLLKSIDEKTNTQKQKSRGDKRKRYTREKQRKARRCLNIPEDIRELHKEFEKDARRFLPEERKGGENSNAEYRSTVEEKEEIPKADTTLRVKTKKGKAYTLQRGILQYTANEHQNLQKQGECLQVVQEQITGDDTSITILKYTRPLNIGSNMVNNIISIDDITTTHMLESAKNDEDVKTKTILLTEMVTGEDWLNKKKCDTFNKNAELKIRQQKRDKHSQKKVTWEEKVLEIHYSDDSCGDSDWRAISKAKQQTEKSKIITKHDCVIETIVPLKCDEDVTFNCQSENITTENTPINKSTIKQLANDLQCYQKIWSLSGGIVEGPIPITDKVVVDGVYHTHKNIVMRWATRQADQGRCAIIVNCWNGELYTECKLPNVLAITMTNPTDILQLSGHMKDVLIVGQIEIHHTELLKELMDGKQNPYVLLQGTHDAITALKDKPMLLDPIPRTHNVQKGGPNGWSTVEKCLYTVATVPFIRYDKNNQGVPMLPDLSFGGVIEKLKKSVKPCDDDSPIPVLKGGDLPCAVQWKGHIDEPLTVLGYNCNGMRAAHKKGEWYQLLETKDKAPDVLCICESKTSLSKLKHFIGGELWTFFRSIYTYMYIFPAQSPNTGTHGTLIATKKKPDAWVTGLTPDSVFNREGRLCGAVFGSRVVVCTYAKSPNYTDLSLPMLTTFWKDMTKFTEQAISKGYNIQGFMDANIITDINLDVSKPNTKYDGVSVMKPGCNKEERELLRDYLLQFQLCDYYRLQNPGKKAYTYFASMRDRHRNDGLRIDFLFGTVATWARDVKIVNSIKGDDHLPVSGILLPDNYENDGHCKKIHCRHEVPNCPCLQELNTKLWLSELNPKQTKFTHIQQLSRIMDDMNKVYDDDSPETKIEGHIRKTFMIREVTSNEASLTPYAPFYLNDKLVRVIVDSGADENMMSIAEARAAMNTKYKLYSADEPLRLASVWGETQQAEGYVWMPMAMKYTDNRGQEQTRSAEVKMWVFQGDVPTLLGTPAMVTMKIGIVPSEDNTIMLSIREGNKEIATVELNEEGIEANPQRVRRIAQKFKEEVLLTAMTDQAVKVGRTVLRVKVPDKYNGETLMFVPGVDNQNIENPLMLQNILTTVQNGSVAIAVSAAREGACLHKNQPLGYATIVTEDCEKQIQFIRNDLKLQQHQMAPSWPTPKGAHHKTAKGNVFNTTKISSKTDDNNLEEEPNNHKGNENVSKFYEKQGFEAFQHDGLKFFRPSEKEVKRLQSIAEYCPDTGKKLDTFKQLCTILEKAANATYEKGAALPVANKSVGVNIIPGAKKVVAGLHQNDASPATRKIVEEETSKLVKIGVVEKANFNEVEYFSRVMLVPKPNGEWRFCVDLRGVNKNVEVEYWPLTKVDIRLQGMAGSKYFTTLDLPQAFHNIPLDTSSRKYFGFVAPSGIYRYKTLPMGFVNSMALFTRLMDMAMLGMGDMVSVYVDDVIVFSKNLG